MRSIARRFGPMLLLAIILSVFLVEAHTRRMVWSTSGDQGDQASYLRYARQMRETNYTAVGGRNRMPVYPFLLSLLWEPGLSEAEFLARAQAFNVNLSCAILLLLFFIYRRHFPALYSAALVAITAFPVLFYRSVLVQTEVLFYLVSFCMFISFWRMLVAPNFRLALLSGALAGLAHLCKASVLPGVVLFAMTLAVKSAWELRNAPGAQLREVCRTPALLAIMLGCFLLVIWPHIQTSKRVFGHYFYNVNSTFYFWCDSWEEARAFGQASGNQKRWPNLPPDQVPSAAKYWREHSGEQIIGRLWRGFIGNAIHDARLNGYYKYLLLLGGATAALALRRRTEFLRLLRAYLFPAVFVALFFSCYIVLYAWYEPLSGDSRFLLALYLPFIFTTSKLIVRLASGRTLQVGGRKVALLSAFVAIMLAFAIAEAIYNGLWLSYHSRAVGSAWRKPNGEPGRSEIQRATSLEPFITAEHQT